MIHLSQNVIRELKRLETKDPYGSGVVRLAIAPGGCAGRIYDWRFRQAEKESDQVIKIDQLKIVISSEDMAYCEGLTIDYSEDLTGGNFRFTNPLAKQTCGCGVSFSLDEVPVDIDKDCAQSENQPLGIS